MRARAWRRRSRSSFLISTSTLRSRRSSASGSRRVDPLDDHDVARFDGDLARQGRLPRPQSKQPKRAGAVAHGVSRATNASCPTTGSGRHPARGTFAPSRRRRAPGSERMRTRIFTEPQQGATYDQLLAVAQRAEAARIRRLLPQRPLPRNGRRPGLPDRPTRGSTLAGIARETSTHPPRHARHLGHVPPARAAGHHRRRGRRDVDGRVELGLGAGWYDDEHEAYGIPFPPLGERFDRLEEQLADPHRAVGDASGRAFALRRPHYQLEDSPALPKPVQSPHPPIIIGGGRPAKRTPRLAARYAAEFNLPFARSERFVEQRDRVRGACDTIGRDPGFADLLVRARGVHRRATTAEIARRAASSAARSTSCARTALCGTPAEAVERSVARGLRSGRNASTCRCSTSTTSTTSTSSPPRCCPPSRPCEH